MIFAESIQIILILSRSLWEVINTFLGSDLFFLCFWTLTLTILSMDSLVESLPHSESLMCWFLHLSEKIKIIYIYTHTCITFLKWGPCASLDFSVLIISPTESSQHSKGTSVIVSASPIWYENNNSLGWSWNAEKKNCPSDYFKRKKRRCWTRWSYLVHIQAFHPILLQSTAWKYHLWYHICCYFLRWISLQTLTRHLETCLKSIWIYRQSAHIAENIRYGAI